MRLPKLSERRTDIPQLARFFLDKAATEMDDSVKILHPSTVDYLCELPWPGNVRQLENTCRWLTVMASGREVLISDLPLEISAMSNVPINYEPQAQAQDWHRSLRLWCDSALQSGQKELLNDALPLFEKTMIEAALAHTNGKKIEASELLGWGRNTLTRKLKDLVVD